MKALLATVVLLSSLVQGGTYDLLWKPKAGQKLTYALRVEGKTDANFTMTSDVILSVKKVEPNGDYTLGTTFKGMVANFFGEEQKMPDEPEEVQRFNVRGDLIDPEKPGEDDGDVVGELMSRASEYVPPLKSVAVGESWKHEFAAEKKWDLPKAIGTYSLVSESDGKLKVSIDYVEQSGVEPTRAKGFAIIDAKDGALILVESEIKNLRFQEGTPSGTAKLSMTRK
ncbi:MAG: hypothetical protein H7Y17_00720 [Chlorobia bacterium]|nr:hypothetical protein [Fimbriimonadaceae bacterium]